MLKQEEFLKALPKAELHLHLEGALPFPKKDHHFNSFDDFRETLYFYCLPYLKNLSGYKKAASAIFLNLVKQNARYLEISFDLRLSQKHNLPYLKIISAIKSQVPPSLSLRVFAGIPRDKDKKETLKWAKKALTTPFLDGIDLHGDETKGHHPKFFSEIFQKARSKGLFTKAHAGEFLGPKSIKETLKHLKIKRIEHGITALEDPKLVVFLKKEKITLDICPISNLKMGLVKNLNEHPIKEFYRKGILVTVSTDDPLIFGQTLTSELQLLIKNLGFSLFDIAKITKNAFSASLLSESEKRKFIREIDYFIKKSLNPKS